MRQKARRFSAGRKESAGFASHIRGMSRFAARRRSPRGEGVPRRPRKPRAHRRRNVYLSPANAAGYALSVLALFLAASVKDFGGALALGLFAGLAYARRNLTVIAPAYALAVIVFSPALWTLLYVAVPVILFFALYFAYFRRRKNVNPFASACAALVGEIPHAVCTAVFGGEIVTVLVCVVVAAVFSYASATFCYAVFLRGPSTRFTPDEAVTAGIVAVAFTYAACGVSAAGFVLAFALVPFFVMLLAFGVSSSAAVAFAVLGGVGATLFFGNPYFAAFAVLAACAVIWLRPFTKWGSAAGALAVCGVFMLWAAEYGFTWQNAVCVALGLMAFVLVPAEWLTRMFGARGGRAATVSGIINRNRREMSARLSSVGRVFCDIADDLAASNGNTNKYTPQRLASEVAKNYCGRCKDREGCFAALGGDTSSVLLPMANAVMSRGKVTILDMPPFITSRCSGMHNLAAVLNSAGESYRHRMEAAGEAVEMKRVMSEQFAGVALVLDSLAGECAESVGYGGELQQTIADELLKHNIVAGDVLVGGQGENIDVTLTVRGEDADKLVLPRIVSSVTGANLETASATPRGDESVVHLAARPVFEVAYGVAEKKRDGERVSGDSRSVVCPSRRRRLFAISDGMGSGDGAAEASAGAISMVENFYRAGFDNAVILSLVNKLLCLTSDDNFSSIDICVIDTVSGGLDIIKMGAVSTFVCRRDSVEIISCEAPPAGVLDRARPLTALRQLYDGDMVVMMSDGVYDALDEQGVVNVTEETATSNPQVLADRLLERALAAGARDDCTVMVMRLFAL